MVVSTLGDAIVRCTRGAARTGSARWRSV